MCHKEIRILNYEHKAYTNFQLRELVEWNIRRKKMSLSNIHIFGNQMKLFPLHWTNTSHLP